MHWFYFGPHRLHQTAKADPIKFDASAGAEAVDWLSVDVDAADWLSVDVDAADWLSVDVDTADWSVLPSQV